ncbi:hypothetical protein P7D63_04970 [Enterococcus raffinosus]|nr:MULTISPECIES: hypothetical protein [Enterococcus]OFU66846.1 hypothetical protein HMPREF3128_04315 [Enterococcus sp. HMSC14A10]MDT2554021.1 hypothetical protein [Enterococcus raffinosus]MDT2570627.1 hypothetical protein [Enterococcus raffinosus]OFT87426.1 hypothetical protein HMPREF3100_07985 [Enterococcus sp. HMSC29A04]QXJ61753.1 hypothetical protein J9537_17405 [Enterococcus raffinosus]
MFHNSTKTFRNTYFLSSFLPAYVFLLLILFFQHYEVTKSILPLDYGLSSMKIIALLTFIMMIISIICLCIVNKILKGVVKGSKSRTQRSAYITRNYNLGMREFLLSVLVPVMTTISIEERPITGFSSMIFLQFLIYLFYSNSSEYFPNLSLQLIKYSVINGRDNKEDRDIYLFVQSNQVSEIINGNADFVYFGKLNMNSEIGIIIEGEKNGN